MEGKRRWKGNERFFHRLGNREQNGECHTHLYKMMKNSAISNLPPTVQSHKILV